MDVDAQLTETGRILSTRRDETGITEHNIAARKLFGKDPAKYDVVTDINPEIIDDQSDSGNRALEMYEKLIGALASDDRYVMLVRIEVNPDPAIIIDGTDGTDEPPLAVTTAYIHIFENATPDDLRYVKGDGNSFVALDGVHSVLKITYGSNIERYEDTEAIVAAQAKVDAPQSAPTSELDLDLLITSANDPSLLFDGLLEQVHSQIPLEHRNDARTVHVQRGVLSWAVEQQRAS